MVQLRWLLVLGGLLGMFSAWGQTPPADALPIRLAVLAHRGMDAALRDWQPHADYLSNALAPRRVVLMPMTLKEINSAVADQRIDLLITNPGHYVELEAGGDVTRIATRRMASSAGPLDRFAGTAITRADHTEISGYADLKGKRILVPDRPSFGGWQLHVREAATDGVDLDSEAGEILAVENQQNVIDGVLSGKGDAGFIRADLIESLVRKGRLKPNDLRIVGERHTPGYPWLHSTRLYPEWPLARLDSVPEELARDVLVALLRMPPSHPAAIAAGIHDWTVPRSYEPVHDLFRELRIGPYANLPISVTDVIERYGSYLAGAGLLLLSLLVVVLLAQRHHNRQLAAEVARRTAAQQALEASEERLRLVATVFAHAQEGVMITSADALILEVNDTFSVITGYPREEVLGRNPSLLQSGRQSSPFYADLWRTLAATGRWRGELWNRRKDGSIYPQFTSISAVTDQQGKISHYVGLFSDITTLKQSQKQLEKLAYYDALTGLPNRLLLADRMKVAMAQAERHEQLLAVCYLDLDGFKPVNDAWGHDAGDHLLVEVSKRLESAVRTSDTVARLGGDEFVLLLGGLNNVEECELALIRIQESISQPIALDEGEAKISASIGVTLCPLDGSDPDALLRHADQAMYKAKQSGRHCFHLFDADHGRLEEARDESRQAILTAIANNEFKLHYQPKVDLRDGRIIGLEALLRWQHPERKLLHPSEFLPVIEYVALDVEVGRWVMAEALRQMELWQRVGIALPVSVNIAAVHLQSTGFHDELSALLQQHPSLPPQQLEIEVLETGAIQDLTRVSAIIQSCRELGVQFSIDDFGTGYSSLNYLRRLPVDTLKIDQSFVRDMLDDPEDHAIVEGVVGLAGAFRRKVLAEGVETVAHGTQLLRLGCELGQGYGIARPMPASELPGWLASWKVPAEWTTA